MSDSVQHEIWQVQVGGQVYQADFAELASWVAEGALQPDDQVRRGNLRWIEAKRVPTLIPHFNAKRDGTAPPPVVVSIVNGAEMELIRAIEVSTVNPNEIQGKQKSSPGPVENTAATDPEFCCNHQTMPSVFLCESCERSYCKGCPNSYGSVKICPSCGSLCKAKAQLAAVKLRDASLKQAIDKGFGFGDLGAAFSYPFKFRFSLIVGGLMFMFFSLGQGATSLGGIFMFVAAIFSFMLANMLIFGVLAHTADSFSQGKIGVNFMPDFDDFSIWDDVLHPFFLWIGIGISSFGLFLVMVAIGGYLVYSSIAAEQRSLLGEIEKLPGTPYYSAQKTVDQSEQVKKMLADVKKQNDQRLQRIQSAEENAGSGETPLSTMPEVNQQHLPSANPNESTTQTNELMKQNQQAQLESVIGKTPETKAKESEEIIKRFITLAAPLVVLAGIGLLWGLFYFPVACAVAGYTRSFAATLNPMVGLDTIKRLGVDYVKLLFMGLIILICWGVVSVLLDLMFSPFDMPGFGNLPAKAICSLFTFYFWVVFFCLIGFMLYKASDRLKLYR